MKFEWMVLDVDKKRKSLFHSLVIKKMSMLVLCAALLLCGGRKKSTRSYNLCCVHESTRRPDAKNGKNTNTVQDK